MTSTVRDRGTSGTQLDICCGTLPICNLRKAMQSIDAHGESWEWSWHVSVGPPGFRIHDRADSYHAALVEIERRWQAWLDAAGLSPR